MAELQIVTYDGCDWDKAHEFSELVSKHDVEVTGESPERWFSVFLYDKRRKVVGGVAGITSWGLCEVSVLAVAKKYRRQGWGKRLVETMENVARKRGCNHVHLHTMSFQGVDFYRAMGYRVLAKLPGSRESYTRYFMTKALPKTAERRQAAATGT
jgi:ribosomal protein S18 acetylase RimI-like enzyme